MEEECDEDGDLFYLGAQTQWLPAEHFLNVNNWDDSLKSSASYNIQQVQIWIASKEACANQTYFAEYSTVASGIGSRDEALKEVLHHGIASSSTTNLLVTDQIAANSNILKLFTHSHKPFACTLCGKAFARQSHLKDHLRTHSDETTFECSKCGKKFGWKCKLNSYLDKCKFSDEKNLTCSQCGKTFANKGSLTSHLRIHSEGKPFPCSQCGRAFRLMSELTKHMPVHSGEKPFTCSQCGKAFARKGSLDMHLLRHLNKNYPCSYCGEEFPQKKYLKEHLLSQAQMKG